MKRILVLLPLLFSFGIADFQKVQVGVIDQNYDITKNQVKRLIEEIEYDLESQSGLNLFDYSNDGKLVDFIYLPSTKKKQDIDRALKDLERKYSRIDSFQNRLEEKQQNIIQKEQKVLNRKSSLDMKIENLNREIESFNRSRITSRELFDKRKTEIERKQRKVQADIDRFNQLNRNYEVALNAYNQQVLDYRIQVREYNRLQRRLEIMVKSSPTIQGAAKGYRKVVYKTFKKDGFTYTDREEKQIMEKIEIYGYESLDHLKAILAHELLHLVGVGHIDEKGALMNPILQENQVLNLQLTYRDIQNIQNSF